MFSNAKLFFLSSLTCAFKTQVSMTFVLYWYGCDPNFTSTLGEFFPFLHKKIFVCESHMRVSQYVVEVEILTLNYLKVSFFRLFLCFFLLTIIFLLDLPLSKYPSVFFFLRKVNIQVFFFRKAKIKVLFFIFINKGKQKS